ncbi:MAG: tRNA lysidine(34) synthetase TilS [Rickettsiales bacterium]|jgi:tRNA(Ile)-lysidine synthase|nr:tRNA lysidine(34) synthetase TilS [Rickettsiales bacterium]
MDEHRLALCLDEFRALLGGKRFAVALSGGCDSLCLALVAKRWADRNKAGVVALTVDHGLREESSEEAFYVHGLCKKYDIDHRILVWAGGKPGSNVESSAREARYGLMSKFCTENSIDHLLVAHHREDQAETFFLRLFRGSGIDGLSSMKKITKLFGIEIIRPFLDIHRSLLKKYLRDIGAVWVEDPSNNDQRFLRNKIRFFLNSFENRDEITDRISFAIGEISKLRTNIEIQSKYVRDRVLEFSEFGSCSIKIGTLLREDESIVFRILAEVAMRVSGNVYRPRLVKLKRLLAHLSKNGPVARYTFYGCIFESWKEGHLIVYREYNSISTDRELVLGEEVFWDNRFSVLLTEDIGRAFVTHIREGKLNALLENREMVNTWYHGALADLRNAEKRIFYTLPVVRVGDNYLLDSESVRIRALHS